MHNLTKRQMQNSREIESAFPEPLRGPVLRKVQFSTIPRFEHLGKETLESWDHHRRSANLDQFLGFMT
jgi:hypothetical protein